MLWQTRHFSELSGADVFAILQLRAIVFVVEQHCVYQDPDNHDLDAYHLTATRNGELMAYCRLLRPGTKYAEWSVGRVITAPLARKTGLGHTLTQQAIAAVNKLGGKVIRISAQAHLEKFYGRHGFVGASAPYDEDGIPHIEMLRSTA